MSAIVSPSSSGICSECNGIEFNLSSFQKLVTAVRNAENFRILSLVIEREFKSRLSLRESCELALFSQSERRLLINRRVLGEVESNLRIPDQHERVGFGIN